MHQIASQCISISKNFLEGMSPDPARTLMAFGHSGLLSQTINPRQHPNTPSTSAIIGSLSNDVFERRTSTGSCPFSFLGDGFAQIFSQIVSIRVKKLSNTNYIASRHITREKSSIPVDVRCSKMSA